MATRKKKKTGSRKKAGSNKKQKKLALQAKQTPKQNLADFER